MARPTFYIIDGHAQIYRAYFAPFRELSSPTGEPTRATFVFLQWLINLIQIKRPDYLAMAIDSGDEKVFRKQISPVYKSNRVSPPDDFYPQEQRILRIIGDTGIPIFVQPGFEADDIIATMVKRLADRDIDVVIVSKDKDLRQLLGPRTRMYDVQGDSFLDPQRMAEQYGYGPEKSIEIQTLMGDSTDNVAGIPGIGEKTAAKLIASYGAIEGIYQNLDKLTPKLRENLQQYADRLPISRQLVTLRNDVEFPFDAEKCKFGGLNVAVLRTHMRELGFTTLLERLEIATEKSAAAEKPAPAKSASVPAPMGGLFDQIADTQEASTAERPKTAAGCDYRLVDTPEVFEAFLAELAGQKRFAFDTETDALGAMSANMIGMSFSWKAGTGWYVPVIGPSGSRHLDAAAVLPRLKPILEDISIAKVGHNIKYDLLVMRRLGITVRGVAMDTMVAAFVLDAGRMQYGIDRLALDLLSFQKVPTSDLIGKGRNQVSMAKVDLARVAAYASEDADIALRLADLFEEQLAESPELRKLLEEVETPLIDVLVQMEQNGIAVDQTVLKEQSFVLGERIDELRKKLFACAGFEFNPDSPKQLQEVLFDRLKLPSAKRTKTGASTDVEVLEKLADLHECPRLILDYRSLVKLKNTYLDSLVDDVNPRTARVHASFNQIGAATGRLSCSDPNLQNIPIRTDEGRRIRLAFVPGDREKNVLLAADYSQIEIRILAHFTREPALVKGLEADEDIHRVVAAEVFGVAPDQVTRDQRAQAKVVNFGIIYGISAQGLARRIEGMDARAAKELIDAYNRRFPAIRTFLDQCVEAARSQGYVRTILGRRRPIPEINSAIVSLRNAGQRMAINSVVQGSAADLIKVAMIHIHRRLKEENRPSKMLLQVHDELVFETPESAVQSESEMIRREMIAAIPLSVPLKVEVGWGKNWQDAK